MEINSKNRLSFCKKLLITLSASLLFCDLYFEASLTNSQKEVGQLPTLKINEHIIKDQVFFVFERIRAKRESV